ncbi:MAG: YCF48-related protein, partial [Dehalococcoidia bacterium]
MREYALKRFLLIFPTLLIASVLVAGMIRLLPGEAVGVGTRGRVRTEESRELARARLGLDRAFHEQYLSWMFGWPVEEGTVLRTRDGGATWKEVKGQSVQSLTRVVFSNATQGWALGDRTIFGTTDGGRLWSRQHREEGHRLNALVFIDEKNGWAVGEGGTILHTREGGQPERTGEDGSRTSWQPQITNTSENLTDVTFIDENGGWAVGENGTVIYTSDGGVTWSLQSTGTTHRLSAGAFVDADNGWVVGSKGTIIHTQDAGVVWLPQISGTSQLLTDVAFADAKNGWAVGEGGAILHTFDGGFTWVPQVSNTERKLTGVAFADALNGLIVGDKGTVLRTDDGGATWAKQESGTSKALTSLALTKGRGGNVIGWAPGAETRWRWGVIGGNMGQSFGGEVSVAKLLARRIPVSVQLMLMGLSIALIVSIPIGVWSAIRQDTWGDYTGRAIAIMGLAVPTFWVATLIIIYGSIWFTWAPPLEYISFFDNPLDNLRFFALPAVVSAIPQMAIFMRMVRATMLEVLREDYIRTAWSKGLRERIVVYRHALKSAMIPVITLLGMQVPFLLGELVLIEQIFNIPGLGRLIFESFTR